ncbi:Uncharacterised protein [uncultured archaeon]|nr:Uncharacterised protein [uncultured archaeon]
MPDLIKMDMRKYLGYVLYMALMLVFVVPIFITPLLGQPYPQLFQTLQALYAPACHQLAERSICYFQDGTIGDCNRDNVAVIGRQQVVDDHGILGYKFPVCARDVAIYGAMLLGALLFPFMRRIDDRIAPPLIYFIIALIPIGIDGGTQLIGLRTSTNELRLITGFIAGIVIPFYVIPILNMFIIGPDKNRDKKQKSSQP